jgi:hypothetical protein
MPELTEDEVFRLLAAGDPFQRLLRRWVREGKIAGTKHGHQIEVTIEDVENLLRDDAAAEEEVRQALSQAMSCGPEVVH